MSSLSMQQRRAIDQAKELLVPSAEELLDQAKVVDLNSKKFGHSQLRNVTAVAQETESPKVVVNFIRYQIGRSARGRQWQYNGFGLRVIQDIEEGVVHEQAKAAGLQAVERITKSGGEADAQALCEAAYMPLTRYYLGYLNRAFYFCDKTEAANQGQKEPALIADPWAIVARTGEVCQDV